MHLAEMGNAAERLAARCVKAILPPPHRSTRTSICHFHKHVSDPGKNVLVFWSFFYWLIERSSISAFKCARSRLLELRTDFRSPGRSVRLGALCIGPPEIVYRLCTTHNLWTMCVCIHTEACACAMYIWVHVCADVGVLLCVYILALVHTTQQ